MSKWIKPSELPKRFWGEVFLGFKIEDQIEVSKNIIMIRQNENRLECYLDIDSEWADFRQDIDYRVMILEYPTIVEEDFK